MHPNESWRARSIMLSQPFLCAPYYVQTATLYASVARAALGKIGRKVVVEIEAAIQTRSQGPAVENHCADEGGGHVTLFLQHLRHCHDSQAQRTGKIHDAV